MCWVTNDIHACTALARKYQHFQIHTTFKIKIMNLLDVWLFSFILFKW